MNARERRWRGAVAASVLLAAVGLLDSSGVVLLSAAIPLVYVGVGALSTVDVPAGLVATRRVDPSPAVPDRAVTVTLTVRNDSDRTLPDVRVADGVPADLAVLEGTPRAGATLAPGEELEATYVVAARRGTHTFRRPHLRVRGLGAGARATTLLETGGDDELVCRLDADAPPIQEYGDGRVGRLATDAPGPGVTFHSTREYHRDDPADRIDWRHYAKRGELATTNYERHVAATVVLVVDAREPCRVGAGPGRPTAVEIAAYAATHAVADLLGRGHDVGLAVLGVDGDGPADLGWLPPAAGTEQRARALELLESAADASGAPHHGRSQVRQLLDVCPPGAQILFASPMLDAAALEAVETWRAAGVPVSVLSPDVVAENTVGGQFAQVRRRTRLARAQSAGARAVDWRRGTALPVVLEAAFEADARLPSGRRVGPPGGTGAGTGAGGGGR